MSLSHEEQSIDLTANESELLSMVLTGMATKAEVMQQVWTSKGIVVTDSSYHQLVRAVRQRLEECGISASVIRTLPRQGLKFMGKAQLLSDASAEPESEHVIDAAPATPLPQPEQHCDAPSPSTEPREDAAPPFAPVGRSAHMHTTPAWRRAIRYGERTLLIGIAVWAGLLTWHMPGFKSLLSSRFTQIVTGAHDQANVKHANMQLLAAIGVHPRPDEHVYEISSGANRWLSICRESGTHVTQGCKTYAMTDISEL
ncbi:hypothetical protein WT59_21895 [Burkholderia territorii]|nr:hypothetical protein WT59_21895 [Burkholderia territorii]